MSVSLTNFVQVNIRNNTSTYASTQRDIAVLINFVQTTALIRDPEVYSEKGNYTNNELTAIKDYCDLFFDNGGKKIRVIDLVYNSSTASNDFAALIKTLNYAEIAISYYDSTTGGNNITESNFRGYIANYESQVEDELYRKIFVGSLAFNAFPAQAIKKEYYVLKFGTPKITATVLAYLTSINIEEEIKDYAFTAELVDNTNDATDSNELVKNCIRDNYNIDAKGIAGETRNIGGNDTFGKELTNQFMLIVLNQTVTETLVRLVSSKLKYNTKGIAQIITAVSSELNKYITNGYLVKGKVWNDRDLVVNNTTIISKGTQLINGYKVVALPYYTNDNGNTFPDVYVILGTVTSIRFIKVDGYAL